MSTDSIMEWGEVHDPTGEFEIHVEWSLISSLYLPEDIQKMINETGISGMVHTVNEHFRITRGHNVLRLGYINRQKAVVPF